MQRVVDHIKKIIRSKTQDEWKAFFRGKVEGLRAFVQNNGEKAAIAGFLLGIFIVLFYKLFILIVALATLVYLVLITVADRDLGG